MTSQQCDYFKVGKETLKELQSLLHQLLIENNQYCERQQMGIIKAVIAYAERHIVMKEKTSPGGDMNDYCEIGLSCAKQSLEEIMVEYQKTQDVPHLLDRIADWYGHSFIDGERHCLMCRAVPYYDKPRHSLKSYE